LKDSRLLALLDRRGEKIYKSGNDISNTRLITRTGREGGGGPAGLAPPPGGPAEVGGPFCFATSGELEGIDWRDIEWCIEEKYGGDMRKDVACDMAVMTMRALTPLI
jgi:hypothetical protein